MAKIVIDARMIYATGIGRYLIRLLENLEQIDSVNHYTVIIQTKDLNLWRPSAANFEVKAIDIPIYTFAEQFRLPKAIRELKPDLVHFPAPNIPIFYLGRHITTVHDLTLLLYKNVQGNALAYDLKQRAFKLIFWRAIKSSKHVIAASKFTAKLLNQKYRAKDKLSVIYLAGDKNEASSDRGGLADYGEYLMYVGNAYPYKNLKRLIQAFDKAGTDQKLLLVGKKDHFYTELEKYVKQKLIRNVIFTGFVPDERLAWLYQHATAFVFPSLSEGFGLPGLEAMQYGLPVASSNATCLPEVYGQAAVYFDPNNTDNMARVIKDLTEDEELRKALAKKGLEQVKKYSWRRMAVETLEVYKKALKEN